MRSFPDSLFPPEAAAYYRERGYWGNETFATLPETWAHNFGAAEALVGTDCSGHHHRLSYSQLADAAARFAAGLAQRGVGKRDAVLIQLPNIVEYVIAVFGVFRLGAIPVFTLPAHRANEIAAFAEATGARTWIGVPSHAGFDYAAMIADLDIDPIFAGEEFRSLLQNEPHPAASVDPTDLAFLQLSGGTTGTPKLIPRSHADYWYSVRESIRICGLSPSSRMLVVLPASHNFTMSSPGILGILGAGGTCVMCPDPTPSTGFGLIEREHITITALVPPLAIAWLAAFRRLDVDISSLEVLQVGGAKFVEEAARRVRPELGCTLQQVFGMAEGLVNYTRLHDPEEIIVATQGRPISPDDDLRIIGPDGEEVAPGERGALLTRGPYTIRSYFRNADPGSFTEDGYYATGDLVRRRPDGYLVVEGRIKDQINRAGEKISAEELENHLMAHPLIEDAAVVGIPDDTLGERTCAWVISEQATTSNFDAELRSWLRAERAVADYKIPDQVVIADTFPVTGVGKLSRKVLRARLRDTLTD